MTTGQIRNLRRVIRDIIREKLPTVAQFGNTWYVGSAVSGPPDALTHGYDPDTPFATLAYCFSTNSPVAAGDVIVMLPSHVETLSTSTALDIDLSVFILGIGSGSRRPTINYTTSTDASITISASDVVMSGFLATCGVNNLTVGFTIQGDDVHMHDFELRDGAGPLAASQWITFANGADRCTVEDFIVSGIDGFDPIRYGAVDRLTVRNCRIEGDYTSGCIRNTGGAGTNIVLGPNLLLSNSNSNDILIATVGATTGHIVGPIFGRIADNAANLDEAVELGDMNLYGQVEIANADSEGGLQWPGTYSTDA